MANFPFAENALLDALFTNSLSPLAYMDLDFNFIRVNQAYATLNEKDPSFYPGKNHFDLFPHKENQVIFKDVVTSGKAYSIEAQEFGCTNPTKNDKNFWNWSLILVSDNQNKPAGVLLQLVNVTPNVILEQKLHEKVTKELHSYDDELETIIESRTKLLQEAVAQLQHENKERKKTEALMLKAKEEAERANTSKSQFLSRMSHELRTPMNAILGFSQLLKLDKLNEKQESNNDEILLAGNHLLSMISDILDLSRIETGNFTVSVTDVPLLRIVDESIALVEHKLSFKNITIHNLVPEEDNITLKADETRLKEVLINLLTNAIKYNHRNGLVSVGYKLLENGLVRIHISDTGKGLTEKEQVDVFEPFNRIGAEYTDIEGVGIGLTISKKLMELMSGSISVESEKEHGSTFYINCPVGQKIKYIDNEENTFDFEDLSSPCAVLYVEDDKSNQILVNNLLIDNPNFNLTISKTAEDGLKKINEQSFGLIILDINLPGMDGYAALEKLKKNGKTKEIPIIALSAAASVADIEKGLNAGFSHYITKPVDLLDFLTVIHQQVSE